jgi:hypothetical protein
MKIKLSSSDAMSPSHSKMVKNAITDAEMTELLPFKYWYFSVTKFIAKVYVYVFGQLTFSIFILSDITQILSFLENGLF